MTLGIIREGKTPPDSRVPLVPEQCKQAKELYGFKIQVQQSPTRCFKDEEYVANGITLAENMSNCDILFGVKEVPIEDLIPDKTYFFFSHTIKKQPYNQPLLKAVLRKNIRLIDYEVLTDENGKRIIAFGKFAGMVGAHNAVWTWFKRHGLAEIPRMYTFPHYENAVSWYKANLELPAIKVLLTGTGRVARGARMVLEDMGFKAVCPNDYLNQSFDHAVFTQLSSLEYVRKSDGSPHSKEEFYTRPEAFTSALIPYTFASDIFINGIYWNPSAPSFFSNEDMLDPRFRIQVVADVTCDIAPEASIPCTVKPSTIADPVYGYDPKSGNVCKPFVDNCVDVMAIDNLPNELARDASMEFGNKLLELVLPELLKPESDLLKRATIAEAGRLGPDFQYLADFAGIAEKQS